ncbi:hypothetical protein CCMA1212_007935 [Trichoderma ghanense]|uniref:Uncharacterized protein n=1 Tax=Trichoderma ghanense TaxID=65468 RepID=A0ABY2GZ36_9HYPO
MDARRESEGRKTTVASKKKRKRKKKKQRKQTNKGLACEWAQSHQAKVDNRVEGALHKRLTPKAKVRGATVPSRTRRTMQVAVGIGSESTRAANCDRPARRALKQFGMRPG